MQETSPNAGTVPAMSPAERARLDAEERVQEQKLIRRLQFMMNLVLQTIAQDGSLTIDEASQMIADARKADLVFVVSANPYLGDFASRDGPDKRPVAVDITYVNVVDPRTGQDLWGDSRQWGYLFVAKATRDLIDEFKTQLAREGR